MTMRQRIRQGHLLGIVCFISITYGSILLFYGVFDHAQRRQTLSDLAPLHRPFSVP